MGLIGFIIVIIVLGFIFDNELGTTMASGGIALLIGIGLTVICFGINPILGIIVGYLYFNGFSNQ